MDQRSWAFHCFFPAPRIAIEGKQRKIYRYESMMSPYDKLKSPLSVKDYLKPDVSFEILDKLAYRVNDNQARTGYKRLAGYFSKLFIDRL